MPLSKGGIDCFGEIVAGLAGRLELLQQREKLFAKCVFHGRGLVGVLGVQDTAKAVRLVLNAADAAGALESGTQPAPNLRGFRRQQHGSASAPGPHLWRGRPRTSARGPDVPGLGTRYTAAGKTIWAELSFDAPDA